MDDKLWLILLLLCQQGWGHMVGRCPAGFVSRGGTDQCYQIQTSGRDRTFSDARTACLDRRGDLAYITNLGLRNWLGQLEATTDNVGPTTLLWVGAQYVDSQWIWIETGELVDNVILPWDGTGSGDCAALTVDSTLKKLSCDSELHYLCRRDITIPEACEYEAEWQQQNHNCYKTSNHKNSWHDSRLGCDMEGGTLATIEGDSEQQLAHDYALGVEDSLWIGLTEEGHAGDFQWMDGSGLNYTKWQPDQPDLSFNGYGAAVVDYAHSYGEWKVQKSTKNFHSLCKKPEGACMPGWEVFEDSCYYFNIEQSDKMVWLDAKETCDDVGASLVVLDTPAEDAFVRDHVPKDYMLWLGLYSDPIQKQFLWVDGSDMGSKNFTFISEEAINSTMASNDAYCVFFQILDSKSSWTPTNCYSPHHYTCEAPAGSPITLQPPSYERFCPVGWSKTGEYCYKFSSEEKSWTSAERYCRSLQSHLASVVTWAEQDFINDNQKGGGWLGLNDRYEEDHYVWSDGSNVIITNWGTGEPSGGHDNCVTMQYNTGIWSDASCNSRLTFTCKMKASTYPLGTLTTTTAVPPDPSVCGDGWLQHPETGECYRLVLEELDFEDARLHCQELEYFDGQSQPDLVSIYSPEEQSFIMKQLAPEHLSQPSLWVGLHNSYDGLYWVDGTPAAYFNLNDGEPNDPDESRCFEILSSTGKWNDASCYSRRAFICEKKSSFYVGPQIPPTPEAECPDGWISYEQSCYYFAEDTATWDTAADNCHNTRNSHLTSVLQDYESDFIQATLKALSIDVIWLGLHDHNTTGKFHWTDGSPLGWTNWGPGEPSDLEDEPCVEMRSSDPSYDGKWNDVTCLAHNNYVCKLPLVLCPDIMNYWEGKCYYSEAVEAMWVVARDLCSKLNTRAELVSISSQEENDYFVGQVAPISGQYWTGLSYQNTSGQWTWTNGDPVEYTNWYDGYPLPPENRYCMEIVHQPGSEDGVWINTDCGDLNRFGCQFRPSHVMGCDKGWHDFNHYCFWYSNDDYSNKLYSFDQAQQECQAMGAELASIHTVEENDFLASYIDQSSTPTWIGLTDNRQMGALYWTDNTDITFTKWDTFENYPFFTYPTCGLFSGNGYNDVGLWTVMSCKTTAYFLCKKPQEPKDITPSNAGCQEGEQANKGSCYGLHTQPLNFEDAARSCEAERSHLVVLNDRYESAYLSAMLGEVGSLTWLGLSAITNDGDAVEYEWITGDKVEFTNWDVNEPAPEHGSCVATSGEKANPGLWSTQSCDDEFSFVCEHVRDGYTTHQPITTMSPGSSCLANWTHLTDRCYKVVQGADTFGGGERFCAAHGGHLASINSLSEQALIQSLSELSQVDDIYNAVWVGLTEGENTGYEWTDGSPFDYVDWDINEPDTDEGRKKCGSSNVYTLSLSVSYCYAHLPFICEAKEGTMVTTSTPPVKPPNLICSDDWSWYLYEDHCYKFISEVAESPMSWWQAHLRCREEGGELASVNTVEENYWIEEMIAELSDIKLWLGGRSYLDTGFTWIDNASFVYFNWAAGEPNNANDQEDCISMFTHNEGYWNDQNCGQLLGRICKRPHGQTHPPHHTTLPPNGHCPQGWVHAGSRCLQVNHELAIFDDARTACQQKGSGSDLASIHSGAEQAYVTALVAAAGEDLWIGLRDMNEFVWMDQTAVTYTNWAQGEPSGYAHPFVMKDHFNGSDLAPVNQYEEDCVITTFDTGRWNDVFCFNGNGYICMMAQDPSLESHHKLPYCSAPYDNFVFYRGDCYLPFYQPLNWQDAESECVRQGAHLSSLLSLAEDSFAWALAQDNSFDTMWIGLSNLQDQQTYRWTDGWPTVYINWGNKPSAENSSECVSLNAYNGQWFGHPCNQSGHFLCKYSNQSVLTAEPPVDGLCPDQRWINLGGGYCYLFRQMTMDWNNANMDCLQQGASLASIHSEEEIKLLTMAAGNMVDPFWIGLVQKANGYGWSDGTGLDFQNWANGEPNNNMEQCTEMYPEAGRWNDADCDTRKMFLCKIRKITNPPQTLQPTTTDNPGHGGHPGDQGGLGAGGIVGIIIAALLAAAAITLIALTYAKNKSKPLQTQQTSLSDKEVIMTTEPAVLNMGDATDSSAA